MEEIIPLDKAQYAGHEIFFAYETELHYDVRVYDTAKGFSVDFVKMPLPEAVIKRFSSKLYEPYWDAPEAYGFFQFGDLIAVLEVTPENWNKRLRVISLWVDRAYRRNGYGRRLMDKAKALMAEKNLRAIVLETQSCNVPAITFYLCQGFRLGGFDTTAYRNDDVERKEVRVEMIYKPPRSRAY